MSVCGPTQVAALVLLPTLPNQAYGTYEVLNPFKIWLMVTLIVGLNLVSYVIHRSMSARKGALVGGVLGGMISSTATTVSHARQSKSLRISPRTVAVVIVVASLANLLFKAGITVLFATREVIVAVVTVFGLTGLLGIALVLWWPDVVVATAAID